MTSSADTFTYWSLLGLSPGSSSDDLKTAFRREAMRWHPDVNADSRNAEERLKWIIQAYKVLSDPQKRYEWEVAGRPTFEIKEIARHCPEVERDPVRDDSQIESSVFSSAEKLLIVLISLFALLFLNFFIL